MATLYTKQQAINDLPFIDDKDLFRAVDLALWLYLDKRKSLKYSINKAAEKRNYKPKAAIERLMRNVIPEELIWDRVGEAMPPNKAKASKESIVQKQKLKKIEKEGIQHVKDIASNS
ncbi:hypothetical protein tloyanaT_13220 [Thalassotalea loyana]|uniref:Uncharacterized protein n=1 Tax=Thalassotalea loyana TaxID=280483 RepID=A0ABQ6HCA5_9GAMM|nr:hypothetical protein [Thalassotalea loyana]GLX85070.1 hypothetical protein tloyanaT_13220 [Thalassotalea loyana]